MQQIGLQAVLDTTQFDAGAKKYQAGVDAMTGVAGKSTKAHGDLSKSLDTAAGKSGNLGKAFQQLTGISLTGAGALLSLGAGIKFCVDKAIESERALAATEAVIKSTGGAAGMTAKQIADLAQSESTLTSIDDEVIQSGENMLLTFTKIKGDVFPAATRAMEDMAVAMAQGDTSAIDLKSTAILLGKALNDPITGLTALKKSGVTFDAQQKETIKTMVAMGDIAGAQKVILAELNKEFGGMAETMGNTAAGKIKKAQNAIDNLAASLGSVLLPVIGDAAQAFTDLITWDERMTKGLLDHAEAVRKAGASYEDYVTEMLRAEVQAGRITQAQAEQVLASKNLDAASKQLIETYSGMSAEEWQNVQMSGQLSQEQIILVDQFRRGSSALNDLVTSLGLDTSATYDAKNAADAATQSIKEQNSATGDFVETLRDMEKVGKTSGKAMSDGAKDLKGFGEDAQATAEKLAILKTNMAGVIGKEMKDYANSTDKLTKEQADLQKEIAKLTASQGLYVGALRSTTSAEGANTKASLDLADTQLSVVTATDKIADAQRKLADETDPIKQALLRDQIAGLEIDISKANLKIGDYTKSLSDSSGGVIDNTTKLNELKGKLEETTQAIRDNEVEHTKKVRLAILEMVQEALVRENLKRGITGLTDEQITALGRMSVAWGLQDQATATANASIIRAVRESGTNVDMLVGKVYDIGNAALGVTPTVTSSYNDMEGKARAAQQAFMDAGDAINAMPTSHDITITTHYVTVGTPEQDVAASHSEQAAAYLAGEMQPGPTPIPTYNIPGRAVGGPVVPGHIYQIEEGGRGELFKPSIGGEIIPLPSASAFLNNISNQYSYPTTTQSTVNNLGGINMGGVNVSSQIGLAAFKAMLTQTLRESGFK